MATKRASVKRAESEWLSSLPENIRKSIPADSLRSGRVRGAARSGAIEDQAQALLESKQLSDRNRERHRVRRRLPRGTKLSDGYLVPDVSRKPEHGTLEQHYEEFWKKPDEAEALVLRELSRILRQFLGELRPLTHETVSRLKVRELEKHVGSYQKHHLEIARAIFELVEGQGPIENYWQNALLDTFLELVEYLTLPTAKNVRNVRSGTSALAEIRRRAPLVPSKLTAKRIDRWAKLATLGRGGGAKGKKNWEACVKALIEEVTNS